MPNVQTRQVVQIRSLFSPHPVTGSGLAHLRVVDEDGDFHAVHVSGAFGVRQLAAAGVTKSDWLAIEVDEFGVLASFEILEQEVG